MKLQGVIPVVVVFAGTALSYAQIWRTDNTKQPEGTPAISLTLSVNPQQIKLGESTQLEVSITNLSGGEIFVYKDIGQSDNSSYDVLVVDDKGVDAPTTPYYRYLHGTRLPGDPHYVPGNRCDRIGPSRLSSRAKESLIEFESGARIPSGAKDPAHFAVFAARVLRLLTPGCSKSKRVCCRLRVAIAQPSPHQPGRTGCNKNNQPSQARRF